jgi:hypothetical protein
VPVQAGPEPTLEVAEPELLLELLVHLLTGPARLDGGGQTPQRGPRRQVAEVVLSGADRSKKTAAPQILHVHACQPVWHPDQTG